MCFKSEKMYKLISNIWRNNSIKSENTKISYIKREQSSLCVNIIKSGFKFSLALFALSFNMRLFTIYLKIYTVIICLVEKC